jgi:hypothetical protein
VINLGHLFKAERKKVIDWILKRQGLPGIAQLKENGL